MYHVKVSDGSEKVVCVCVFRGVATALPVATYDVGQKNFAFGFYQTIQPTRGSVVETKREKE